jgi:hypothetical protein
MVGTLERREAPVEADYSGSSVETKVEQRIDGEQPPLQGISPLDTSGGKYGEHTRSWSWWWHRSGVIGTLGQRPGSDDAEAVLRVQLYFTKAMVENSPKALRCTSLYRDLWADQ